MSYKNSAAIVIGNNGGIGQSVLEQLKSSNQYDQVLEKIFLQKKNI